MPNYQTPQRMDSEMKDDENSWDDKRSVDAMHISVGLKKACDTAPPEEVELGGRMQEGANALDALLSADTPPDRLVRGHHIHIVRYGFGDAFAGTGFGSSWEMDKVFLFRYGIG